MSYHEHMFGLEKECVFYDTEYTTWEGAMERNWSGTNEHREIVQIGAIIVDTSRFEELDSFSVLVRPHINPKLSSYFIELTGISAELVDREGVGFKEALDAFYEWAGERHLYAFGRDYDVIQENCDLSGVRNPFPVDHFHNSRTIFKDRGIPVENYTSGTITNAFGIEPIRRGHDGLNDARTVLDGFRLLAERNRN